MEDSSKTLYIMRGFPGSGKSFTAKKLAPKENIFSTDDFWGEEYDFDMSRLREAHEWNQKRVISAMESGMTPIVVDNTNITRKAFNPYIDMAKQFGYRVELKESDSPWWESIKFILRHKNERDIEKWSEFLFKKNTHNVPKAAIANMMNQWENL